MPILELGSPDFGHAFVPVDSLTSSPRSSTGSTSVLEWNSNSGSEGFSVHSLEHPHSSPLIPAPSPFSKESLLDHDQVFASFTAPAPIVDSVSNTVTSDDEYRNLLGTIGERLSLMSSIAQWQSHSYHETAGLDRPESPSAIDNPDNTVDDKQHSTTAPSSPDRSISISAVTARPSHPGPVSSLFLPPAPPKPHVYPAPPSVVSSHSKTEGISIAQYFQLKSTKTEVAEQVQPPVDGPPRPISAVSCLSYVSSAESPVQTLVEVRPLDRDAETPPPCNTWYSRTKDARPSSTRANPPSIHPPRFQCSSTCPETSSYERIYPPQFGPSTAWNYFLDSRWPPSNKSQMENNNPGPQVNPFTTRVTSPSSQGIDTPAGNLKNNAPSRAARPIPPTISRQFEAIMPSVKPIKPTVPNVPCLTNIHDRQPPYATFPYDSFYGRVHKSSNSPRIPSLPQAPSSTYPTYCQIPLSRTRDFGQASPESTHCRLPLAPALPSTPSISVRWPSPTPSRSLRSASAVPPSPPEVNLRPAYLRHPTAAGEPNGLSGSAPYVPVTPNPAPSFNGPYSSTQRVSRALPIPINLKPFGPYTQAPYTPRYTGSTLPRDMHLSAGPPTWGPTPRRLRFAPLPPTPSTGPPYLGNPGLPYAAPLPPYPHPYPMSYPYQGPAPQIPAPVSTPYSSWRPATHNSSQCYAPHPVFWYSDGSIVFRIENVGYKVHRHFFERHSAYFRDLLACPMYAVTSPLPHNITLLDVRKGDFERLLSIFYPSNLVDQELFTVEEWTSILTLSDKWNFAQLKTLATRELGYITTTIEKIALSKQYNIGNPQWLLAAYRELCTRRHPLSLVEGEKLGLETVIKIWEVQHELAMETSTWGRSVDDVVQDKFGFL